LSYDDSLRLLKRSFIGGGEGEFYFRMLDQLRALWHVDWLDIGIGRDGSSVAPFVKYCSARGQTVAITGVDPDAEPVGTVDGAIRWTLVRNWFHLWTPTGTFDLVNADQSLYYMEDLGAETRRIISAMKPRGLLIATCWLRDDTLHRIRQGLFADAKSDLVGENLEQMLRAQLSLELVDRAEFRTQVDLTSCLEDDRRLRAAIRVIARGVVFNDMETRMRKAAEILRDLPALAPRLNLALCFRRRA
jgi:SAM-dependent methyltransferase